MVALILLVVSVGLADALNPSTLAPALVLATQRDATKRLVAFTCGVFAVSLAGGLVLVAGPGEVIVDVLPHPRPEVKHIAEVAGGILLVVLGYAAWIGRARLARRLEGSSREPGGGRGALVAGAAIMAVELPTALPYFAAIAAVLAATSAFLGRAMLVLLYNVAFVAPLLALIAVRKLAGENAQARIDALGRWMRERGPVLLAALLATAGLVLIGFGVRGLIRG